MSYQEYYKKNIKKRISFMDKFNYFYSLLGYEINKIIEKNSNFIFFSAGHSKLVKHLNYKKVFISEIVEDFAKDVSKENSNISVLGKSDLESIKNESIDDVLITSLEYAEDPVDLLKYINKNVSSDCKINIITNNIFWVPLFQFFEKLSLKFKHPRRNFITSNFIHNLCFLSDFELLDQKRIIIFPFKIPLISYFLNHIFAKLPIIRYFCLANIFVLKDQNAMLKETIAKLNIENKRLSAYDIENDKLKKMLEYKNKSEFKLEVANVLNHNLSPNLNSFILDIGSNSNININLPVMDMRGIIGKTYIVDSDKTVIQLITDKNYRVSVRIGKNRNLGVFIPNYSRIGVIEGIPKSQEVMIGEIVLTSGISDIYPGNIPIAEVISTHIDPNELFQNITVRILADIFNPDYVFVIK